MSENRTPECTECGADYKLPPGIPTDPKKVPPPTRGKNLAKPPTFAKSPIRPAQPKADKKDDEIRRLRQQNKELLKQNSSTSTPVEKNENENLELLKELKKSILLHKKAGLDTKETQAKIDELENACANKEPPKTATSEVLKRKMRQAEHRANQIAQNVQKSTETLERQRDLLLDAEEEVQLLTEQHNQALRKEGFERAPLPAELLLIPEHLDGDAQKKYQEELDALELSRVRHLQEAAAITGRLQAYTKAPETPKPEPVAAMDIDPAGEPPAQDGASDNGPPNPSAKKLPKQNGPKPKTPEEIAAAKEKRAAAQKAADLRIEQVSEANKKQRIGESVNISVDDAEDF